MSDLKKYISRKKKKRQKDLLRAMMKVTNSSSWGNASSARVNQSD